MREQAAVFDYDGTLIDTVPVKIESYARATMEEFGVDASKRAIIKETQLKLGGAPKFVQLAETCRALGIEATEEQTESWGRRYVAYNDEHTPKCPEFPIVRQMLKELGQRHDVYLTSGQPDDMLKTDAARRGLTGFFVEVQGGNKAEFCKGLREKGYERVTLVGDGKYDRLAAEEAGVEFVMIESNKDLERVFRALAGG